MPLRKPRAVASDPFKSAKWDELAEGRDLSPSDAPALELLVQWYSVIQRCIDDMADANGQVAYMNDMGDRIGAAVRYNFSPNFSIQMSVESRKVNSR